MAEFLDFLDRFDGGGAGKVGDQFEGGGLLSLIGNALMKPAGYADRKSGMGSMRPQMRPAMQHGSGSGMTPTNNYVPPQQSPLEQFGGQQPAPYQSPSPLEMFGGQQPAPYQPPSPVYSGRGEAGMPYQSPSPLEQFGGQQPAPYQPPAPVYSGRGEAGMPYPQGVETDEMRQIIDYLRSQGVTVY
jgi:hypothetical protein